MRSALAYFLFGIASCAFALEIAFRLLPVSTSTNTGYAVDSAIVTYPPHHEFRTATGWDLRNAYLQRSNNYGFLTSRDFGPQADAVALIGDSYVEASMLPEEARLGPQLERLLDGRPVYVLGGPGSNLLDYAERIRFAAERFGIHDFVVLIERGDVLQSLCGSRNIHSQCLDATTLAPRVEKLAPPGTLKRLIRHSALAQYLFSQLKLDPAKLFNPRHVLAAPSEARAALNPSATPSLAAVDTIVHTFFSRIQPYATGRLVLIVDGVRERASSEKARPDEVRARFMAYAATRGALVVDMEPIFRQFMQDTGLNLSVSPSDQHWNPAAIRLAAEEVAPVLSKKQ
jgi:hypothetical protein